MVAHNDGHKKSAQLSMCFRRGLSALIVGCVDEKQASFPVRVNLTSVHSVHFLKTNYVL